MDQTICLIKNIYFQWIKIKNSIFLQLPLPRRLLFHQHFLCVFLQNNSKNLWMDFTQIFTKPTYCDHLTIE